MRKFVVLILILAIAFLFLVPESMLGEYRGLLRAKYFLKNAAISAKSIAISLIKGERPKEFDVIEKKTQEATEAAKEGAKDVVKDAAVDTIKGL